MRRVAAARHPRRQPRGQARAEGSDSTLGRSPAAAGAGVPSAQPLGTHISAGSTTVCTPPADATPAQTGSSPGSQPPGQQPDVQDVLIPDPALDPKPPAGGGASRPPRTDRPALSASPSKPPTQMSPILTPASDTSYASTPGKRDRGRNVPLSDPLRMATRPRLDVGTPTQVTPLADHPDVQALRPNDLIRYSCTPSVGFAVLALGSNSRSSLSGSPPPGARWPRRPGPSRSGACSGQSQLKARGSTSVRRWLGS